MGLWVAPSILGLAAVILAACWDRVPARWAVHWTAMDRPDGWVSKGFLAAFSLLIVAALIVALMEVLMAAGARRQQAPEIAAASQSAVRNTGVGFALAFSILSLALPLAQPQSVFPLIVPVLLSLVLPIVVGVARVKKAIAAAKARGEPGLEGWDGAIYRNAEDRRLWVPKLSGFGWTINFAHRWAWPALILLMTPAIAAVVLSAVLRRSR